MIVFDFVVSKDYNQSLFHRLLQIIRHGMWRLFFIVKDRTKYFKQLIQGAKDKQINPSMEYDDTMLSDYMEQLSKVDRSVYFSG